MSAFLFCYMIMGKVLLCTKYFRHKKTRCYIRASLWGHNVDTIGERIVFLREKLDISQKELAEQLGITAASLSRYENNIYDPKGTIITSLCGLLHTSADYLLGMTDNCNAIGSHVMPSEKEVYFWKLYQALPSEDKIRIEERILTLHEIHENSKRN